MKKDEYQNGQVVKVSWKEDEGGGWYSNKRGKRGVIHRNGMEFWVETEINPRVNWSDITSIQPIQPYLEAHKGKIPDSGISLKEAVKMQKNFTPPTEQ